MATLLSKNAWAKILVFHKRMAFFSFKTYLCRIFLARIPTQRLRIDPCAKFQLNWTKDKRTRILSWILTSLLMTSAKYLWLLRDFVPEYHHAKFGCNWTTNKGETEGVAQCMWFQKTPA